jgi:hypothetical protein
LISFAEVIGDLGSSTSLCGRYFVHPQHSLLTVVVGQWLDALTPHMNEKWTPEERA